MHFQKLPNIWIEEFIRIRSLSCNAYIKGIMRSLSKIIRHQKLQKRAQEGDQELKDSSAFNFSILLLHSLAIYLIFFIFLFSKVMCG